MVLLNAILIYMVAGLVFPDFFGEEVVDLRENFYAHRGWLFSLAFAIIVASVCKMVVLDGRLPDTMNLIFHAIFGVTFGTAASSATDDSRTRRAEPRVLSRLVRIVGPTPGIASSADWMVRCPRSFL